MDLTEFKELVLRIVSLASVLKNKYTAQTGAAVNYACIFCKSESEFSEFSSLASELGEVVLETKMGPVFALNEALDSVAGPLKLLKIRKVDPSRYERGDADFTVSNYAEFKEKYVGVSGFKLIVREKFEMIELVDNEFDVRVYFSSVPLIEQLGMKCACGKIAKYSTKLSFNGNPIDGWECSACGEEYYNPEKAEKILLLNRLN